MKVKSVNGSPFSNAPSHYETPKYNDRLSGLGPAGCRCLMKRLRLSGEDEGRSGAKPCRPDTRQPAGPFEKLHRSLCNLTLACRLSGVDPAACRTV